MNDKAERVLIVDDRPENLYALEKILKRMPFELVRALSGMEALTQVIRQGNFVLVILDINMPEMDGYETAKMIRENEPTSAVPILFVSAIDEDDHRRLDTGPPGATDYIFKPVDSKKLIAKVQEMLGR